MTDYIRRDTAIELMKKEAAEMSESFEELGGESGIYADAYEDAANMLQDMAAADVAEVVYGRWIPTEYPFMNECEDCSSCGYRTLYGNGYNYCPNCGARMDGGEDRAVS